MPLSTVTVCWNSRQVSPSVLVNSSCGVTVPEFPESDRTDANKIRGCQSQVWFVAERAGDRIRFHAISDAAIVSGLIAVLLRIYSDRKPADILATPPDFIEALQLEQHLSPTRSNGLASMLKAIRRMAAEADAET